MIEVRKLIPQVYNQSRDFSVFMGVLQALINEADIGSLKLSKLPTESILPRGLSTYENLRGYFRFMLKEKGSLESILLAISLAGGKTIVKLEDEKGNLIVTEDEGSKWLYSDYQTVDRSNIPNANKDYVVYYTNKILAPGHLDTTILNVNLKDPSLVDQGLLEELLYYIKPVNVIVRLNKGLIVNQAV